MILDNANVLTMDASMPRAAAIALAGGKVIGGVDSREDAIASHAHERIDLQGATVVPGFVDTHVHFRAWAIALAGTRVQLHDATSLDGLLDRVRMHALAGDRAADAPPVPAAHGAAASTAAGAWVLGAGWADELLPASVDVGAMLHEAAGGRPAAIVSRDGHAAWTTPKALAALGIELAALELPGGVVERTTDGRFTGVLRERSAWELRRLLPEDDLTNRTLAAAMRNASRCGVTTLHDMDGAAALRAWRGLELERGLGLRVVVHLLEADLEHAAALGVGTGFGSSRLSIGGVKAFADGTMGSGTAWLHRPALGAATGDVGVPITAGDDLRRLARRAAAAGFPLVVHAIGDAAFTDVVDAFEATQDHWSDLPMRPRIEHAQLARRADIERCARLGIGLGIQPTHLVSDRDGAEQAWGDRLEDAYAWRTMLDAGCGVLLGSDAPIERLTPLAAIHAAVYRDGGAHGLAAARGGWRPEQAMTPEEAMLASTAWPADAMGRGEQAGRLVPGRDADLVVLSGDPLSGETASIEVVATMVAGRWTWGAPNLY